jgi:hypothetical protein
MAGSGAFPLIRPFFSEADPRNTYGGQALNSDLRPLPSVFSLEPLKLGTRSEGVGLS